MGNYIFNVVYIEDTDGSLPSSEYMELKSHHT